MLRAMIGKLVMVDIPGTTLEAGTRAHLERYQPGGVILFRKNIASFEQTRDLIADLKSILGEELLVAIDGEGGGVWRMNFLPHAPSAASLGAGDDESTTFEVGRAVARGLRAMGFNWNFAPVLDVNNNPLNPVISDRSFGEDPAHVARMGAAWARGLMREGVAACAKHFPGHGDTALDSHHALPTVIKDLATLEGLEFLPFRETLSLMPSIMTAHIVYPALDSLPATLSKPILTGLLRERWGYDGVIVTDSMGMAAVEAGWGRGEAAVLSVLAGADMLEGLGRQSAQEATFDALEAAERDGRIPKAQIERSAARLQALARDYPSAPLEYTAAEMDADRALMQGAWRSGVVAVGEVRLPAAGEAVTLVAPREVPGENVSELGISGERLARALEGVYRVRSVLFDAEQPLEALPKVRAAQARGETLVFATTTRRRLSQDARALALETKPHLHLALWNAYNVQDVPAPALVTFGYRPEAIAALLEVLRGAPVTGRAPVRLRVAE
jgi:beta-N-acetylhexosaminidase